MTAAIGIDLGTTHSLVARRKDRRVQVLPNAEGELLTPSAVAFLRDGSTLVGRAALAHAERHSAEVVLSAKRRMGDPTPFQLPHRTVTAIEVSACILDRLATDAALALGHPVRDVVLTVPAYFNARQRDETMQAAHRAGLKVMRILNEPTAAALAHGLGNSTSQTVVVWDLGGGTFDVSVLRTGHGVHEVLAVAGDNHLGGDDWDRSLAEHLLEVGRTLGTGTGSRRSDGDSQTRYRLRQVARQTRHALTDAAQAVVDLSRLGAGWSRDPIEVTRDRLEGVTAGLYARLERPTRNALEDADLSVDDVDRVILVGGATRMPGVRALASRIFGQAPYTRLDPDLAVAEGAAIQASILVQEERHCTLVDVLPHAVGIEVEGGRVTSLVPRNHAIPTRASRIFTTAGDDQDAVCIHVLQGEGPRVDDAVSLGHFELRGIPALPRGEARIEVTFEADASGILHVSAEDLFSASRRQVEIVTLGEPGSQVMDPVSA